MFSRTRFVRVACGSLIVFLLATGCGDGGPERGNVTGKVTLDGKPLEGADLEFQPTEGSPSYGTTNPDGKYKLMYTRDKKGAMVGEHTVRITTSTTATDENGNEIRVPQQVPPEYSREGVVKEVKPGRNKFDFDLKQQ
ncbi:carboxypeptidase regulatory-like domain-containing protein [Planctomycetota bacterium]